MRRLRSPALPASHHSPKARERVEIGKKMPRAAEFIFKQQQRIIMKAATT